jgi:hypothetical protein
MSGNVASRYMTIEGIVERGGLPVENSPLLRGSGSPDLVRFGRHLYSDKPPVLPAIGSVVYAMLYWSGIRFAGSPAQFVLANFALVGAVVVVASALTIVWLRQLLQVVSFRPWISDVLALAFGFGSLLFTYGVTFNNHSVAAALVTGGLALAVLDRSDGSAFRWRRFGAGFLASLAATIDLPVGALLCAALGIWMMARSRALPIDYMAGVIPPLLLHCWLQSLVTGTPLPAEMYPKAFDYPGSYWTTHAGTWKEHGPRWQFGLELLVGPQGWLTVTPVLALAPFGLMLVVARRQDPLRPLAWVVTAMVSALLVYYVWGVRRTDYSGQSFGTRHLLAISPACYVFAVVAIDRLRSRFAWTVFVLLLAVGATYAVAGMIDPWSRVETRARTNLVLKLLQRAVVYPWSSYQR